MRYRRAAHDEVAEVARRRLELLTAELADIARPPVEPAAAPAEPATSPLGAPAPVERTRPGRHAHRPVGVVARVLGWLHDRLPPTLQGTVGLSSSHLTVVALLVAGGLAVTSWWVLRADDDAVVMAPAAAPATTVSIPAFGTVAEAAPGAVAGDTSGAASGPSVASGTSTTAEAAVVVDVAGKVRRPGIATLPAGSRVADAIEAAGGVRRGVDLTMLNLARVLVDGEQIVVGVAPPAGVAAPAASAPAGGAAGGPGQLVNLNTAGQTELEELPGVGPVTAQAILQWRTDNGAFTAVDELLEVSGIGEATLSKIAPFVTL